MLLLFLPLTKEIRLGDSRSDNRVVLIWAFKQLLLNRLNLLLLFYRLSKTIEVFVQDLLLALHRPLRITGGSKAHISQFLAVVMT